MKGREAARLVDATSALRLVAMVAEERVCIAKAMVSGAQGYFQ